MTLYKNRQNGNVTHPHYVKYEMNSKGDTSNMMPNLN